jgi:hypothetical protein
MTSTHCHWSGAPSAQEAEEQEQNDHGEGHAEEPQDDRHERFPLLTDVWKSSRSGVGSRGKLKTELENDSQVRQTPRAQAPHRPPTRSPARRRLPVRPRGHHR